MKAKSRVLRSHLGNFLVMDPLADMLNSLQTAARVGRPSALVPHSKLKLAVAKALEEEGYLKSVVVAGKKNRKLIQCDLIYQDQVAKLAGARRVSKPSRRIYVQSRELGRLKRQRGTALLSTSRGLKTAPAAAAEQLGGEWLLTVWS